MKNCNHWNDDCTCDVGFLGSLTLLGAMLWKDFKRPKPTPAPPPEPPQEIKSNK